MIERSGKFAIHVLRTGQRELAGTLGKSALKSPDKLKGIAYEINAEGFAILHDALAWVGCEVQQTVPAGDSTLVVAAVIDTGMIGEGAALTMGEAGFRHAG